MNKLPSELKIGPITWKITYGKTGKDAVGLTHSHKNEIIIFHKLNEEQKKVTLLHEILHAIAYTYGFYPDKKNLEESVVSIFTVPLLSVFIENPELKKYLFN